MKYKHTISKMQNDKRLTEYRKQKDAIQARVKRTEENQKRNSLLKKAIKAGDEKLIKKFRKPIETNLSKKNS